MHLGAKQQSLVYSVPSAYRDCCIAPRIMLELINLPRHQGGCVDITHFDATLHHANDVQIVKVRRFSIVQFRLTVLARFMIVLERHVHAQRSRNRLSIVYRQLQMTICSRCQCNFWRQSKVLCSEKNRYRSSLFALSDASGYLN